MEIQDETRCAQGLGWIEPGYYSLTPPVYPSATYARNADLSYPANRIYTRADNPTYDQVTELIRQLEEGAAAQLFASGMAAATAVFQTLNPGDCAILPEQVYNGTRHWAENNLKRTGIRVEYVNACEPAQLEAKIARNQPRLVWLETPSNPELSITDLDISITLAHRYGAVTVVDNTFATPVLTKPILYGADIVMHSATKYLNGHGDVLAGVLVSRENNDLWQQIAHLAHDGGALAGPFEAWLLLRGMRTLYLRMEKICRNARAVAEYLDRHPGVRKVLYPGLPDFPGHAVAARQMNGKFGGMISLLVEGGEKRAVEVQGRVKVFKRATSLGTVESLIEHRASYEGPGTRVPRDLLRLSIGIEEAADLIADLEQALG